MTRSSPADAGPPDPIDRLYARLVKAAESDDFDGYADLFDERAALVLPKCAPIGGRDGVRTWARQFLGQYDARSDLFAVLDRRVGDTVAFVPTDYSCSVALIGVAPAGSAPGPLITYLDFGNTRFPLAPGAVFRQVTSGPIPR